MEEESGNHVEISRCHFLQNVAKDGGALSLLPYRWLPRMTNSTSLCVYCGLPF